MEAVLRSLKVSHEEVMRATGWDTITANFTTVLSSAPEALAELVSETKLFFWAVNWSEPFFAYMGGFHALVVLLLLWFTVWRRCSDERLLCISILLCLLTCASPFLNRVGHTYADRIFVEPGVNYFDENGFFISIVFLLPLMAWAVGLQVRLIWRLLCTLVSVKRHEFQQRGRRQEKEKEAAKKDK